MATLVAEHAGSEAREFALQNGPNFIGRARDNAVVINHDSLSRRHACLFIERDAARLTDLDSKNGTFVHDVRIREVSLAADGNFRCGDVTLTLRGLQPPRVGPLLEIDLARRRPQLSDFWAHSDELRGSPSRLELGAQRHAREQRGKSLLQLFEALATLRHEDVLERVLDLLFQVLPIDHAAALLAESGAARWSLAAARSRDGFSACECSQHVVDYVRQHGTAVLFADAPQDPRLAGASSIVDQEIRASLCVPLPLRERQSGVLYVDARRSACSLSEEDLEFLCVFAGYAAITIDNVSLAKQLEEEAVVRSHLLRFFPASTAMQILASGRTSLAPVKTLVTALFCDLTGFTTLSSTKDPTDVVRLLNQYFQTLAEVVFRFGGTLEKYIGDALLAVWGAPFLREDDATRAVQAAIEMQRKFMELEHTWRDEDAVALGVHIGLDTGLVAAGNIGSERYLQYATIGEATTLASRICGAAQSGDILISGATRNALAGAQFDLVPVPAIQVKGRAQPLEVWRVTWAAGKAPVCG
jgi:adenylate cyclase